MGTKYKTKSNGVTFSALENRVAPMVIKLAESLERTANQLGGGDGHADGKHAVMKLAKQIKKTVERRPR